MAIRRPPKANVGVASTKKSHEARSVSVKEEKNAGMRKGPGEGILVFGLPEINMFSKSPVVIKSIIITEKYTKMYGKGMRAEMARMMAN